MNNVIKVIILGIIEGFTEFLPISSTGHLILAGEFLKLEPQSFQNAFNVIIQFGAILAVVKNYFSKLNPFATKKLMTYTDMSSYKDLSLKEKLNFRFKNAHRPTLRLWLKVIIAVLPAVVLGLLFDDLIDEYLFKPLVVAIMLIFWGIVIILVEKRRNYKIVSPKLSDLTPSQVFKIGFFQCLAMIPGTSRSAATIIGAMLLGTSRKVAAEFSFFLAIPTMLGATTLKIIKLGADFTYMEIGLILLGSVISFIVADIVIRTFMKYIKNNDFSIFGYYRIILGIAVLVLLMR